MSQCLHHRYQPGSPSLSWIEPLPPGTIRRSQLYYYDMQNPMFQHGIDKT